MEVSGIMHTPTSLPQTVDSERNVHDCCSKTASGGWKKRLFLLARAYLRSLWLTRVMAHEIINSRMAPKAETQALWKRPEKVPII